MEKSGNEEDNVRFGGGGVGVGFSRDHIILCPTRVFLSFHMSIEFCKIYILAHEFFTISLSNPQFFIMLYSTPKLCF